MTPISHVLSGLFALVIAGSPAAQTTYPEKGIGESIQPRSLKGTPERAIRCLNVPLTAFGLMLISPSCAPSAGAIGASLVVKPV